MKPSTQFLIPVLLLSFVTLCVAASAEPPRIDYQPKDQTVTLYQPTAFGVIANGTAPLAYQWRKDGGPIVGATNDQLVLEQPQFSDRGKYSVIVSNAESSVTSAEALLTVNSPKGGGIDFSFAWGSSINGLVRSVDVQPDGRVLIAGDFTTVHGAFRGGIARLNADGTTDYTFMNGFSGIDGSESPPIVTSAAVQSDGKMLLVGSFIVEGAKRNYIARLNADGTLDSGFQNGLSVSGGEVSSFAMQMDGKVLIGGGFDKINGASRNHIARLNADGTADSSFQNGLSGAGGTLDASIDSISVQSDGKVLIGGVFTTINGVSRIGVARLNPDGSLDRGFLNGLSGTDNWVYSVALQTDGKVVIGGQFSMVNGERYDRIARLNTDGTVDRGFLNGLPGVNGNIFSVSVQSDGKVLIAGAFDAVNGVSRTNIARLNADGALDNNFQNGMEGAVGNPATTYVKSVAVQGDGKVLIGGEFTSVNGVSRNRIARLNPDGSLDNGFQNGLTGTSEVVRSLVVQSDGKVLIGGEFTIVNGANRNSIARLTADGILDSNFLNGLAGVNGSVFSVAVQSESKVLIGGNFTMVNGVSRTNLARLNADGTLDSSFLNGLSGTIFGVNSLAVQTDGKILIGGEFTSVNGVSRNHIARLNPDGSLDNGFQNGLSGADLFVASLAVQSDGKALIGGFFTTVNGVSRSRIARLNADGSLDNGFQNGLSGADSFVASLVVQSDGKVLLGGQFFTVNGVSHSGIARLNTDGSLDSGFQAGVFGCCVNSVAVQSDGKVLIGGQFLLVNNEARYGIARLNADGTLDSGFQNGLSGTSGPFPVFVNSVAVQSDCKVLIGGAIIAVNGVPAVGFARLWTGGDVPPLIRSINRSGASVNLIWDAVCNRTYRVQYNANISANIWTDLAPDVSATSGTASETDTTLGGAKERFYRVQLLP